MRRRWPSILAVTAAVLLVIAVVGWLWATNLADPMPETELALESGSDVTVSTDPWLTFDPTERSGTGFILYPGGRVPAQAYAPPARAIAASGYLTVIPEMPFGLAVLDPNAADSIMAAHPEIDRWVVGGHSLGGAMAAGFADGNEDVDGLALWAAYPAGGVDLSADGIEVASVYATEDGLTSLEEIEASASQLPSEAAFTKIEGGNHAGFGWYGPQDGDGEATITRLDQQEQAVAATLDLLEAVETGG